MLLDLTRFRQPVTHLDRSFAPADVGDEADSYRVVAPVELTFDVHKDKEVFRLRGRMRTRIELSCSRCLEPFEMPVDSAFDLRYLPASAIAADEEGQVADEDLETSYYRDDQIDVNELIREQLYLALPMKPLCAESCRGLCPRCGANLNLGPCGCAVEWTDPRLEPLRALKDDHA